MARKKSAKYTQEDGVDLPQTIYVAWNSIDPDDRCLIAEQTAEGADDSTVCVVVGEYRLVRRGTVVRPEPAFLPLS